MHIEHSVIVQTHDDLRPISIREFRASVWMIGSAALGYVLIMSFFVR
jgi:hypothetical protein